jgi:predicted transcriptional regulator
MNGTMKEKALELIQRLPPDATVEDMIEKLYFLEEVERGLRQIDAGQGVSHEEAKLRFGR